MTDLSPAAQQVFWEFNRAASGKPDDWHYLPAIAASTAQWGADMELEACCKWLHWQNLATHSELIPSLRAARRPNPPSLKEQALAAIESGLMTDERLETIRRALEELPE